MRSESAQLHQASGALAKQYNELCYLSEVGLEFQKVTVGGARQVDRVRYTRYADDLTFSAPRTGYLNAVDPALRKAVRNIGWPRLTINEDKTVLATTKYRRQVTGLILTNDGSVSLGRDRKRELRASLRWAQQGRLSEQEMSHLCGLLAFAHAVEPEFVERMTKRYGEGLMSLVKTNANVSLRD